MADIKQITDMLRGSQAKTAGETQAAKAQNENPTMDRSNQLQEIEMSTDQNEQLLLNGKFEGDPGQSLEGDIGLDLDTIRLPQDFGASGGVKKLVTTVPLRKPNKSLFIRTHASFRMDVSLLKYGNENDLYLVMPGMISELGEFPKAHRVVLATDRTNTPFIWPLTLPDPDHPNMWHTSAMEADVVAQSQWIRVESNKNLGAYEIFVAQGQLSAPTWPEMPWNQLVSIAFKQKIIDSPDHVVAQKLRGEV